MQDQVPDKELHKKSDATEEIDSFYIFILLLLHLLPANNNRNRCPTEIDNVIKTLQYRTFKWANSGNRLTFSESSCLTNPENARQKPKPIKRRAACPKQAKHQTISTM